MNLVSNLEEKIKSRERTEIASKIMAALLSDWTIYSNHIYKHENPAKRLAEVSVLYTDWLISELKK